MCVDACAGVFLSTYAGISPRETNLRVSVLVFARALAAFRYGDAVVWEGVFECVSAVGCIFSQTNPVVSESPDTIVRPDWVEDIAIAPRRSQAASRRRRTAWKLKSCWRLILVRRTQQRARTRRGYGVHRRQRAPCSVFCSPRARYLSRRRGRRESQNGYGCPCSQVFLWLVSGRPNDW